MADKTKNTPNKPALQILTFTKGDAESKNFVRAAMDLNGEAMPKPMPFLVTNTGELYLSKVLHQQSGSGKRFRVTLEILD